MQINRIRDLEFTNVTTRSPQLPYICGRPDAIVEDVRFVTCSFTRTDRGWCEKRPCTGYLMTPGQTYEPQPMTMKYTQNIQFIDTVFSSEV